MLRRTYDYEYGRSRQLCKDMPPELAYISPVHAGLQFETERRISWDNSTRLTRGRDPYCLFQYTLSGHCEFEDPAGRRKLDAGKAFLVPIPSPTRYWRPDDTHWEWIWIVFGGEVSRRIVDKVNQEVGYTFEMEMNSAPIRILEQLYAGAIRGERKTPYEVCGQVHLFLMAICQLVLSQRDELPPGISAAQQMIENNYSDPDLDLNQLAEAAALSKYHFARLFKEATGRSPWQQLIRTRMERALELLSYTRMPIKQICREAGFRHYSYFCTQFRKYHGMTPGSVQRGR